ncbi:MAG TPA: aminopeptidase P N-terminal domain-containing protein, partial [Thermoanaerobaculia bacterium]
MRVHLEPPRVRGSFPVRARDLFGVVVLLLSVQAPGLDFPILEPPAAMFKDHREKYLAKLPLGSIAILHATPLKTMSNDVEYLYRQDSDFWYLTGIEDPDAVALFRPNAADGQRYVVFVRPRDPRAESYEGPRAGPREAAAAYGADAAFSSEELLDRIARYDPSSRS